MPVRQLRPAKAAEHVQLVDRLSQEWERPDPSAAEPVILEETDPHGDLVHVYVVWSDWGDLDRERRGEVIMDAAGRVKQPAEILRITIAMGLTPDEADRFGINWR